MTDDAKRKRKGARKREKEIDEAEVSASLAEKLEIRNDCLPPQAYEIPEGVDPWAPIPITKEENPGGLLEESSFAILFPKYRGNPTATA